MKVLCTGNIEMFAPVERVFDVVAEIEKWPAWFAGVVSAQQPAQRPVAIKEEFFLCMHAGRRRWHETFEITRLVRNAFLSLEGELSAARRIDIRLEQRSGSTRVGLSVGYPVFGGWFGKIAEFVTRRRTRRIVADSLMHLKHKVEDAVDSATETEWRVPEHANILPLPAHVRAARSSEPIGVA